MAVAWVAVVWAAAAANGCKAPLRLRQATTRWVQWLTCWAKQACRCRQAHPTLALPHLLSLRLRWCWTSRRRPRPPP